MAEIRSDTLVEGFGYLEAPRWHEGALWVSDLQRRQVVRIDPDGTPETVFEAESTPIGLGFVGADLRVVSSDTMEVLHVSGGAVNSRVALSPVAQVAANDMAVDARGRCYVSHYGYDLFGGAEPVGTGLVLVDTDGTVEPAGSDLVFPNGVAISAAGDRLVVAESFGQRLSEFTVADDGRLHDRRVLVQFSSEEEMVDGICLDNEGGVWIGLPFLGEFRRVDTAGRVTDVVRPARPSFTVACALGGEDLRTLYMAVADTSLEMLADNWGGQARVEVATVEVPGFVTP